MGRTAVRVAPWTLMVALILFCVAKGMLLTAGVSLPVDPDTVRDIGFIRGILDGNLFGDPTIAEAWRWYPPLIHALAALAIAITGAEPLTAWTGIGVWLNLAAPIAFFLMARSLFGDWPAALSAAVLVLVNGSLMGGDESAGYTPWTLTPALVWPLFFAGVWAIHRFTTALSWRGAIGIGCGLGVVFLAHTVPAILLSGIVTAAALVQPARWSRRILWLGLVAAIEWLWALAFMAPLVWSYRLRIANPVPGAWVHGILAVDGVPWRLLALNAPGLIAGLVILWSRPGGLSRTASAILSAWIVLCAAFLVRHLLCHLGCLDGASCRVFVIAPHHFHVYLQAGWAVLIGYALWFGWHAGRQRRCGWAAAGLALAGLAGLLMQTRDVDARDQVAARPDIVLDRAAYDWISRNTHPDDQFVTPLPREADQMGPAAATVIAAGRRLVAPPEIHANPYLPWAPMNARRLSYLSELHAGSGALCRLVGEAAPATFFLLPVEMSDATAGLEPIVRTATHVLHRVSTSACTASAVQIARIDPR